MNYNETLQKFGLALALCSLDDKIIIKRIELPGVNRTQYLISTNEKKSPLDYSIDPENLDIATVENLLKSVLCLEAQNIIHKKINPKKLVSYDSMYDLATKIINGQKDHLMNTYDKYMSYPSSAERRNSPERKIMDKYLKNLETFGNTFYFDNRPDYQTNEYKITEVMYSIMSLISGEDLCLDMDALSKRVYPDLLTAESYLAIKQCEKDYEDYLKLNHLTLTDPSQPKIVEPQFRTPQLSLGDEIYLICKYKQLGLLRGAIFKTSDGFDIPLEKSSEDTNTFDDPELTYQDYLDNNCDYDSDDCNQLDDCDGDKNLDADDGEIYGVLYQNDDADEDEISQITINTFGLDLIDKAREKAKHEPTLQDLIDDVHKKRNALQDYYNKHFGNKDKNQNNPNLKPKDDDQYSKDDNQNPNDRDQNSKDL